MKKIENKIKIVIELLKKDIGIDISLTSWSLMDKTTPEIKYTCLI